MSGTFIGISHDNALSVAVVADPPTAGGVRTVHAFVTDGLSISEQFTGGASGNVFALDNADGTLSGTIDSSGVSGQVTLHTTKRSFTAQPPTSPVAGFFTVNIDGADKTLTGTSNTGQTMSGVITTPVGNNLQVQGTIAASGGAPPEANFIGSISPNANGKELWIVLPAPNETRGGPVTGSGTGFVEASL